MKILAEGATTMPCRNPPLTFDRAWEVLHYDPQTGLFRWRLGRKGCRAGGIAGSSHHEGYWRIMIDGRSYLGHRLAWFMATGNWPADLIDHKNLVRSDNRLSAIRPATHSQNHANSPVSAANTSGLKGASLDRRRNLWLAQIKHQGRHYFLGRFDTKEQAHRAYVAAAGRLHGEFARAG